MDIIIAEPVKNTPSTTSTIKNTTNDINIIYSEDPKHINISIINITNGIKYIVVYF